MLKDPYLVVLSDLKVRIKNKDDPKLSFTFYPRVPFYLITCKTQ